MTGIIIMTDEQNHSRQPRILIADDQPDVLKALRLLLKPEGFQVETASCVAEIIDAVGARDFDVVLMDMNYIRDSMCFRESSKLTICCRSL